MNNSSNDERVYPNGLVDQALRNYGEELSPPAPQAVDNPVKLLISGSDGWELPDSIIGAMILDWHKSVGAGLFSIVTDDGPVGMAVADIVNSDSIPLDIHILDDDGRNPHRRRFLRMLDTQPTHALMFTVENSRAWAVERLVEAGVKVVVLNFDSFAATRRRFEDSR